MYVKIVQKQHKMLQIRTDINQESNNFQKYQTTLKLCPKRSFKWLSREADVS